MIEWILVVWLIVGDPGARVVAPAFEVGTFRRLDDCEKSAGTVRFQRGDQEFIALCVERDKQ
jgi:hypothetical protein